MFVIAVVGVVDSVCVADAIDVAEVVDAAIVFLVLSPSTRTNSDERRQRGRHALGGAARLRSHSLSGTNGVRVVPTKNTKTQKLGSHK